MPCHPAGPERIERRRAHLLARIHRRFQTVTQPLRIADLNLRFTRIREPDHVLDQIVEQEDQRERISGERKSGDELHLPYWAELWDSSIGLGAFLAQDRIPPWCDMPGERASVLDLGCGMGLSGLVAAALGARVTLADLEPDAMLFARLNTLDYFDQVQVRRLDWRRDRLDSGFDRILGADVLYERAQWEFLEPFWRAHLKRNGVVLLGEPGRQTGDLFVDWIVARGWSLGIFDQPVATRHKPIRIFRLTPAPTTPDQELG